MGSGIIGIPKCPRTHPGMMYLDDSSVVGGREWVCRECGERLYISSDGTVAGPTSASAPPINEHRGNHSGKPRRNERSHYSSSKERERNYIQANPRES